MSVRGVGGTVLCFLSLAGMAGPGIAVGQDLRFDDEQGLAAVHMMSRPGGAWVASNARYWTTDSGEPREYLMAIRRAADGHAATGCMWGRSDGVATRRFWTFFRAWNPSAGAVIVYQASPGGAIGAGSERPHPEDGTEEIITLTTPDGASTRIRHVAEHPTEDRIITRSFDEVSGGWEPRREYTWEWEPGVSSAPCEESRRTSTGASGDPGDSLAFMEPLIGVWAPDPAWVRENPGMESLIPLDLEWGPNRLSIAYRAGMPDAAGRFFTSGTIAWNPASRRAEFIVSQSTDGLLFKGVYEPLDGGDVRRVYTVFYADREPIEFRETFFFVDDDTIDWLTEWRVDGEWVPRRGIGQPEFRAHRTDRESS